jgi:lipoprotein-releasing system permease protein
MKFSTFVALKYFRAKRRTGFISIITNVSIVGVAIGVIALVIVLSIFNGFEKEVRNRLLGSDGHLRFRKYWNEPIDKYMELREELLGFEHVIGATPVVRGKAMLIGRRDQAVVVKGLDQETAKDVTSIRESIIMGDYNLGMVQHNDREIPGIILGRWLAESALAMEIGDTIIISAIPKNVGIFSQPLLMEFKLTGLSEIGFYEYDNLFAYVDIKQAQKLFSIPDQASWIEIKLEDYRLADQVSEKIDDAFSYPFLSQTWYKQQKTLYNWLELEKLLYFAVLSLIILVAAFNIVSSLIMIVMEKTREIGILKSMGATPGMIQRIFLNEGLIIGVLGTSIGWIVGYFILWLQMEYRILSLPQDIFISVMFRSIFTTLISF